MHTALYKELIVRRGLIYRYYWSPSAHQKPALLFLHGFPSYASDWQKQVVYFRELGYGILAPDLLGAGGTAKPLDPQVFRLNDMARDIMDILAAEGIHKAIGIAHDWGSVLLSHLSLLYPDSFQAYGWIGLCFMEPITVRFDLNMAMVYTKELLGYEGYAYWQFFLRDDAHSVIQQHVDSFLQLMYPNNPDDWLTYMALPNKTAGCIEGDLRLGRPSYLDEEEYAVLRNNILAGGVQSSLNWYKAQVENIDLQDNRHHGDCTRSSCSITEIPENTWKLLAPSFVVVALKDYICTPQRVKITMPKYASDVEYCEVESGHWPHLEYPEEVNAALHRWMEARGW
ncbi:alpha/beta-hydrolase [Lenzites betulinus]|nr:alpha/beta-hydrolase [Lenzites betulinus]